MQYRRLALTIACMTAAFATVAPATPVAFADTSDVSTDPTGAHVVLSHDRSWVEVGHPSSHTDDGDGSRHATGCMRRWQPTNAAIYLRPGRLPNEYTIVPMPPPPGPGYQAYYVYCDDEYITSVWLLPSQFTANGIGDARALAEEIARDLPYPPATIGTSPAARGLAGLDTWFWVEGYSGRPIHDEVTGWDLRVEVEAVPAQVVWSFGDGSQPIRGTLGRRPPTRSDMAHMFELHSPADGFAVQAGITLEVRWRTNGGPWQQLDPVRRTATRSFPVTEARAVLLPS